jgi:hypothetical protein
MKHSMKYSITGGLGGAHSLLPGEKEEFNLLPGRRRSLFVLECYCHVPLKGPFYQKKIYRSDGHQMDGHQMDVHQMDGKVGSAANLRHPFVLLVARAESSSPRASQRVKRRRARCALSQPLSE